MSQMPRLENQVGQINKVLWWTLSSALTVAALSGCSKDSSSEADGVPATQVCASTLDTSAAAALERISGTDKFAELEVQSTANGASQEFSLSGAAEGLHGTASERNQCTIYTAGDKSAHPLIEVDFEVATSHPDKRTALQKNSQKTTVYSIGAYAATNANFGASLFFACSTKGPEGAKPYVKASMYSSGDQFEEEETSKDRMIILNSISRRLAEKLGCAKDASLPTEVPAPITE